MSDITDSMARYIDNIPDGAVHTCSDLCIKPPCLIVRGKQEIERLRAERDEAVALLLDINSRDRHIEDGRYLIPMYVGDYERIDALLNANSVDETADREDEAHG